jgi:hypothetical protein
MTGASSGGEYFPWLYQRTMYTDNLLMTGGWWANPAVISSIRSPYLLTANVLPLGDSLLISSIRLFIPVAQAVTIGGSILGAGAYKTGSSMSFTNEGGFSHQSSFAFQRPRFQLGAAASAPIAGSFGVIGTIGSDLRSLGSRTENAASPGFGAGWLSPALAHSINLSAAVMFIYHSPARSFWEKGGKLGLRIHAFDSLIAGSAEYSFSFDKGFGVFTPELADYEVLKAIISAKLYERLAVMAGFSTDLAYTYNNQSCAHIGLELKESLEFPFSGGYDIGFRFGQDWLIMHRIWVGLNLEGLKKSGKGIKQ